MDMLHGVFAEQIRRNIEARMRKEAERNDPWNELTMRDVELTEEVLKQAPDWDLV